MNPGINQRPQEPILRNTSEKYVTGPFPASPQTMTAAPTEEVTLSPAALSLSPRVSTIATSVSAAASEAIVTVNCHCSSDAGDDDCQKLETGGAGLVNGAGVEGGDEDEDDDKDSGNGSVLEFVPPSEFQVRASFNGEPNLCDSRESRNLRQRFFVHLRTHLACS